MLVGFRYFVTIHVHITGLVKDLPSSLDHGRHNFDFHKSSHRPPPPSLDNTESKIGWVVFPLLIIVLGLIIMRERQIRVCRKLRSNHGMP